MTGHVLDRLSAYLDDELDGIERGRVEKHLGDCAACARHLEELLAVDEATRRLELSEPPEGYFETLPGRLRERARSEAQARRRYLVPVWTWAAAAAVLVAVIAPLVLMPSLMRARLATPSAEKSLEVATPAPAAARPAEPAPAKGEAAGGAAGLRDEARARALPAASAAPTTVAAKPLQPAAAPRDKEARLPLALGAGLAATPAAGEPARAPAVPSETEAAQPEALETGLPSTRVAAPVPDRRSDTDKGRLEARAASTEVKAQPLQEQPSPGAAAAGRAAAPPPAHGETAVAAKRVGPRASAAEQAAFDGLLARTVATAEDARALRESWREFVAAHPDSRLADEARVRVVEAGVLAHRLGRDPADRETAQADAKGYLARTDAAQAERVRRVLASLER